jgi:hypothetical protein
MKRLHCLCVLVVGLLAGCAQVGPRNASGQQVVDWMATFRSGDLRLTCDTACSGAWGANRRTVKGYYDGQSWNDLVRSIALVGMRVDSGYFYLGRAAESLRHHDAARLYYRLALGTTFKCAGLINNCDGIDVPREASAGLARLARAIPATPAANTPARPAEIPARLRPESRPKEEPLVR